MVSKKDNLALFILDLEPLELNDQLAEPQKVATDPKYPRFEVRTVGPNGSLLIKFPNQEWIKPNEWAINHRNTIENKMKEDLERILRLGAQPNLSKMGYYDREYLLYDPTITVEHLLDGISYDENTFNSIRQNYIDYINANYLLGN